MHASSIASTTSTGESALRRVKCCEFGCGNPGRRELRHAFFVGFRIVAIVSNCSQRDSVDSDFSQVESVLEESHPWKPSQPSSPAARLSLSATTSAFDRAPRRSVPPLLGAVSGIGFAAVFFVMTVAGRDRAAGHLRRPDARRALHPCCWSLAPLGAAAIGALAHASTLDGQDCASRAKRRPSRRLPGDAKLAGNRGGMA